MRANNLYHETTVGKEVVMDVTVRNGGTRRLDNIKLTTEKPLGWDTRIEPDVISSLEPEKELTVKVTIIPPSDGGVGAQEVKIKTEAMADNRKVDTEDKDSPHPGKCFDFCLRHHLPDPVAGWLYRGIVWFGMKLSKDSYFSL